MAPRDPIADDFIADWLSPSQAVEILDKAYKPVTGVSKRALLEHLTGGMVEAVSANSTFHGGRRDHREVFYKIPREDWEHVSPADDLWITGQFTFTGSEYGSGDHVTTRHYNVRFRPQAIHSIVAPLLAGRPPAKDEPVDDDGPKGPAVSADALKAWFDVYQKVYGGLAEDTLDNAYKSARGMFPGKFVSRDRVRDLAGGRAPGRKPRKDS